MSGKLSSLLVRDGVVPVRKVEEAIQRQVIYGGTLGTNLLEMKAISEKELRDYLVRTFELQPPEPEWLEEPDAEAQELLPQKLAERHRVVPARREGDVLKVIVMQTFEPASLAALERETGVTLKPYVVPEVRFHYAMERHFDVPMRPRFANLMRAETRRRTSPDLYMQRVVLEDAAKQARAAAQAEAAHQAEEAALAEQASAAKAEAEAQQRAAAEDKAEAPQVRTASLVDLPTPAPAKPPEPEPAPPAPAPAPAPVAEPATPREADSGSWWKPRMEPLGDSPAPEPAAPAPAVASSAPAPAPVAPAEKRTRSTVAMPELRTATLDAALGDLAEAGARYEVLGRALEYLSGRMTRCLAFLIKGDQAVLAAGHDPDGALKRDISLPLDQPSVIKTVVVSKAHYLGPRPKDAGTAAIYEALEQDAPAALIAFPVLIKDRVLLVFVGDDKGKAPNAVYLPRFAEVSQRVSNVLLAVIQRAKQGDARTKTSSKKSKRKKKR